MSVQTDLKKDIEALLDADSRIDVRTISVEIYDRDVRLSGFVSTLAALEAVEDAVRSVRGVKNIVNQIKIKYPNDREILTDDSICANICNLLHLDRNVDPGAIHAAVEDGFVTLSGSVRSYWEKIYCQKVVANVNGVRQVVNMLSVVNTASATDDDIANHIREALQRVDAIDIENVTIFVENGIVSITGKVPHWNAYYSAEYAARHTRGVLDVKNQLILSY